MKPDAATAPQQMHLSEEKYLPALRYSKRAPGLGHPEMFPRRAAEALGEGKSWKDAGLHYGWETELVPTLRDSHLPGGVGSESTAESRQ